MENITTMDGRITQKLWLKTSLVISKLLADGCIGDAFMDINREFYQQCGISAYQFRKVRTFCIGIWLIKISRAGKPNKIKISLILEKYQEILDSEHIYELKP